MDTTAEGVETHDDLNLIRELGCSQIQGYIFGKPVPGEVARDIANQASMEADGYQTSREHRQRLMRRAIAQIGNKTVEIRLRNISSRGALVESEASIAPGSSLVIDIVGVGPVIGEVRWAQKGKFGLEFVEEFDLSRLAAPKKEARNDAGMMNPWYGGQKVGA